MIDLNDSLDDIFGPGETVPTPKALPTDEAAVRIRTLAPVFAEVCPKCRGTGSFTSYSGRQVGQCFACKGKGKNTYKTSPEKREAARKGTAERQARQGLGHWDTFVDTHPSLAAWLLKKAPSFDFAASLKAGIEKYGALTERQQATLVGMVERDAAKAVAAAAPKVGVMIDTTKLVEAFATRVASGAKTGKLRFAGVLVSLDRRDTSVLIVKSTTRQVEGTFGMGPEYLGKIVCGTFLAARACTPEDTAALILAAADPSAAAKAYGFATSSCSCCGKTLSDPVSIAAGIGPICAEGYGW